MWELAQNVWVNICQVTDHLIGWNNTPVHRSRSCLYCSHPNKQVRSHANKLHLVPAQRPTDACYEQHKLFHQIQSQPEMYAQCHVKRAIWIGGSYHTSPVVNRTLNGIVKEWLFLLHSTNYQVTNCSQLAQYEPSIDCKQLIIVHLDDTTDDTTDNWTPQQLESHIQHASQRSVLFISRNNLQTLGDKIVQTWTNLYPFIYIVFNQETDMNWLAFRKIHFALLSCLTRCTVEQFLEMCKSHFPNKITIVTDQSDVENCTPALIIGCHTKMLTKSFFY